MRRSTPNTSTNTSHDKDEPLVRISIKPSKPFFFSGERFEATITIANVRSRNTRAGAGTRTAIDPRDRARASIDGFAQRYSAKPDSPSSGFGPRRLGLIGKPEEDPDQEVELPSTAKLENITSLPVTPQKKSHLAGRSQSVDFDNLRNEDGSQQVPGRQYHFPPYKSMPSDSFNHFGRQHQEPQSPALIRTQDRSPSLPSPLRPLNLLSGMG